MKRYNKKKAPTKAESEWMEQVAQLCCVVTGERGVQIHHLVECGRRLGNDYVLPVSVFTHRDIYKFSFAEQLELCKQVWDKLGREWQEPVSKIVSRNNNIQK